MSSDRNARVAIENDGSLAGHFTADRWRKDEQPQMGVEVRLGPSATSLVAQETSDICSAAVEMLCAELRVPFQMPRVAVDPTLDEEEFEVAVGGSVRAVGSFETSWAALWAQCPGAGPGGRSGLASGTGVATADLPPERKVGRLLDEVLLDDPSLLLDLDAARQLGEQIAFGFQSQAWTAVVRGLVARRVAINVDELSALAQPADLTADLGAWIEDCACRARSHEVELRLGPDLYNEIRPRGADSTFSAELLPLMNDGLFTELGVGFPNPTVNRVPVMPPRDFEVVVNRVRRAGGELPENAVLVNIAPALAAEMVPEGFEPGGYITPSNSAVATWIATEHRPALGEDFLSWDPAEFLILQLAANLREAAAEFADLAWTHQMYGGLDMAYDGELVRLVEGRHSRETVAAVLRRLAWEAVPIRDFPLVLERMLDYSVAGADSGAPDQAIPIDVWLAEHVRRGMRRRVIHTAMPWLSWAETGDPLEPAVRHVSSLSLDPRAERELVAQLQDRAPESAYSAAVAAPFLRALRRALDAVGDGQLPIIMAPGSIRPQLRRIIAAQFPRVRVVSPEEVPPDAEIDVRGVISVSGEAAAAPTGIRLHP